MLPLALYSFAAQGAQDAQSNGDDSGASATETVDKVTALIEQHGPRVAMALAILVIGYILAKIVTGIVKKALGKSNVDATLAIFLGNLTYMMLMVFVVIAAISKLGVETASFVAILGAAGFAVGFALQGSLANFAAGVMLLIFRPFKVGDVVEAGGTKGKVAEVGIFATIFTTPDNQKVIVGNSSITGGNITNVSAFPTRRVDMVFGISYEDDIDKAKQILVDMLANDERVLKDPAPTIVVGNLGDSSVDILCRPWVNSADYWGLLWDMQENVKKAYDAADISIPYPQRDVHVHQVA